MINGHVLKQTMNLKENKDLFDEIQSKVEEKLNYQEFVFGTIIGSIITGVIKMQLSEEVKLEKLKTIIEQTKIDGTRLKIEESVSLMLGVEAIIIGLYDFDMEDYKDLTKTKKEVELPNDYSDFESKVDLKVNELANTVYKEEIMDDEIEHMEISLIVIAHIIAENLNEQNENKAKNSFKLSEIYLKKKYDVEITIIGKGLASMINKKTKTIKVEFERGLITFKKTETNNQKLSRTMSRLIELQNKI